MLGACLAVKKTRYWKKWAFQGGSILNKGLLGGAGAYLFFDPGSLQSNSGVQSVWHPSHAQHG